MWRVHLVDAGAKHATSRRRINVAVAFDLSSRRVDRDCIKPFKDSVYPAVWIRVDERTTTRKNVCRRSLSPDLLVWAPGGG